MSHRILVTAALVAVTGCAASPERMREVPTSTLCVAYLSLPSYNVWQGARAEEIARRGADCSGYSGIAAQKRASDQAAQDAAIRAGTAIMQGGSQPATQSYGGGTATGTAFLKGERIQGLNKICYYDRLGSAVAITVGAAELCPISLP